MLATKIKMKPNCGDSNDLTEIDSIYVTGCSNEGFFKKAVLHDYVNEHPKSIQVSIKPFPCLVAATSANGEKYVRSEANGTTRDNLLNLPRE